MTMPLVASAIDCNRARGLYVCSLPAKDASKGRAAETGGRLLCTCNPTGLPGAGGSVAAPRPTQQNNARESKQTETEFDAAGISKRMLEQ